MPSYPTAGLSNLDSSAGAAASLANANHTAFEHWKPDPSTSANKAANVAKDYKVAPSWHPDPSASANKAANLAKDYKAAPLWHPNPSASANKAANLAKDYKATPLWQPEKTTTGSKAAAVAAKDGGNVQIWRPEATQVGSSAAGQAMRAKGLSPQVDYGYTADGNKKALLAATGAMSTSRKRAGSSPTVKGSFPDSENSAANALSAATFANKPSTKTVQPKTEALGGSVSSADAARIHNAAMTNLSREMYTSNPPVASEVEEKNRLAGLRAAAVSMAKQMYEVQQRAIERATGAENPDSQYAASSVHNRKALISTDDSHQSPPQYVNLQEAAQKLAAERLAKLHDEHAAYRSYYGANAAPQSRLSIRNRQRQRASSEGYANESDEERSNQIRSEMSMFSNKVAQVDANKRQKDRDSLIAAAQRNVRASMHGMDEKVFAETGKVSSAMMQSWEIKAHARAEADSQARMANHGMVNIGGGRYLDQSEIDAIAAQKVQPTLDEISEKAEQARARDEQRRLEAQERNAIVAAKAQDDKERSLRTREDWKLFKGRVNPVVAILIPYLSYIVDEKREAKAKRDEERARKAEEKHLRDAEKRKSRTVTASPGVAMEPSTSDLEPPAIDPIPQFDPISTEESKLTQVPSEWPDTGTDSTKEPPDLDSTEIQKESGSDAAEGYTRPEQIAWESSELRRVSAEKPTRLDLLSRESYKAETNSFPESIQIIGVAANKVETDPQGVQKIKPVSLTGLSDAELIAARVLSSPTESNKAIEIVPLPSALPEAALSSKTSKTSKNSTDETADPSALLKHRDPIEVRIAPSATTETIISGPSSGPKSPKGDSKVSSWLKSKFSRRTSKTPKPDISPSESNSRIPISNEPVTTAGASSSSLDRDDSSAREVAMAGKRYAGANNGTMVDDDLYAASGNEPVKERQETASSSVSSLSDSNGTRGRSELRREGTGDSHSEEFEEARDHFDSEELAPPASFNNNGRASDSPVRDSKFQEIL